MNHMYQMNHNETTQTDAPHVEVGIGNSARHVHGESVHEYTRMSVN